MADDGNFVAELQSTWNGAATANETPGFVNSVVSGNVISISGAISDSMRSFPFGLGFIFGFSLAVLIGCFCACFSSVCCCCFRRIGRVLSNLIGRESHCSHCNVVVPVRNNMRVGPAFSDGQNLQKRMAPLEHAVNDKPFFYHLHSYPNKENVVQELPHPTAPYRLV